jgi:hypothetical protein
MIHFLPMTIYGSSIVYYAVVLAKSGSTRRSASVVVDSVGGHHVAVRKVVPEGSQVSLQCRVPVNSQLSRMMDLIEPSLVSNPVIWLRFDMKGIIHLLLLFHFKILFNRFWLYRSVQPGGYLSRWHSVDRHQSSTSSDLPRGHPNLYAHCIIT